MFATIFQLKANVHGYVLLELSARRIQTIITIGGIKAAKVRNYEKSSQIYLDIYYDSAFGRRSFGVRSLGNEDNFSFNRQFVRYNYDCRRNA